MRALKDYRPRPIDRTIFAVLAALHIANGLYLVGPWYLDMTGSGQAALITMFNSVDAVKFYGIALLLDGLALIYASAGRGARLYTQIVSGALLGGFLLRLYALIGVFITSESWRPPGYLSHAATVVMLGAYWIWVRRCVKSIR